MTIEASGLVANLITLLDAHLSTHSMPHTNTTNNTNSTTSTASDTNNNDSNNTNNNNNQQQQQASTDHISTAQQTTTHGGQHGNEVAVQRMFVYCVLWSVGALLEVGERGLLDAKLRTLTDVLPTKVCCVILCACVGWGGVGVRGWGGGVVLFVMYEQCM